MFIAPRTCCDRCSVLCRQINVITTETATAAGIRKVCTVREMSSNPRMHRNAINSVKSHHFIIGRRFDIGLVTCRLMLHQLAVAGFVEWGRRNCRAVIRLQCNVLAVDGRAGCGWPRARVADDVRSFAAATRAAVVDVNRDAYHGDDDDEQSDQADDGVRHVPHSFHKNAR